jgi:predicted regulator of Ras-like GTPase activity (Roadblock/LC7/MglB family)
VNAERWIDILREVTGVAGVRGALILSSDDGLVVTDAAMPDLNTADVAALAAGVIVRVTRTAAALGNATPGVIHVTAEAGTLLAVAGPPPLWLAAVTDADAELGRLRLLMGDFAGALT